MTGLTLALVLFATPVFCPPEIGHIRWDDVKSKVAADDIEIRGSVWDRDRNGKPSAGDVMRIESARRGGSTIGISEAWIVLKGELARSVARDLAKSDVRTSCETPFQIEGAPTIHDGKALARHFEALAPSAVAVQEAEPEAPAAAGLKFEF